MSADRKAPDLGVAFVLANGGRLPASIKQKVAARPVRKYRMLVKETREFYITVSARSVVGARAFVEVTVDPPGRLTRERRESIDEHHRRLELEGKLIHAPLLSPKDQFVTH